MKDMKMSPAEQEATAPTTILDEQDRYPWGLKLSLNEPSLQKLNLPAMPSVGDVLTIVARVKVTDINSSESEDGLNRCMGLQITEMEVGPSEQDNQTDEDDAKVGNMLYPEQNTIIPPPSNGRLYH